MYHQYDKCLIFVLEGRAFARSDILNAVIAASGGYCVGLAMTWETLDLWQTIELIEAVNGR
jgi:hypothetical protein